MAKIITQINQIQGNYQDVFLYTINASFNGIAETIEEAQIKILFPDILKIYLGDMQEPVKNVTQEPLENGTLYTFDFGSISDLGIAVRLGMGATFQPITVSGTTVSITPELWINGNLYDSFSSDSIQLLVNPNFLVTQEQIIPQVNAAPNGVIYYRVLLKNYGDLGGAINNVEIICNCPEGFLLDASYPIIGKDISSSSFGDRSQDEARGVIEDNMVRFNISSFYGEAYEFIYRVIIDSTVTIDQAYTSTISWSIDQIQQEGFRGETTISTPIYKSNFSLYGPTYSLPNKLVNYEMNFSNGGNQALDSMNLTITLPEEVSFNSFTTGIFQLYEIKELIDMEYEILYLTKGQVAGSVGRYNTNVNSTIEIADLLQSSNIENDFLLSLTWRFDRIPVGFSTKTVPLFNGIIRNSAAIGSVIPCVLNLEYLANSVPSSNETTRLTTIQDICVLTPTFASSIRSNPIRPGETFQYTIGANCRNSRLNTPIFLFYLPKELEYIGNISLSLYDYFKSISEVAPPEPLIIPNFTDTGETLIIFTFSEDAALELPQKSRLKLTFSVRVLTTARGEFSSFFLLDSVDSSGQVASNRQSYEDVDLRLVPYTNSDNNIYARSSSLANAILFFVSISSRKEVKGFLDQDFVEQKELGSTMAGEEVFYRITITNTGNADLESIEIIDILPHSGDTGVIEIDTLRESEFPLILTNEVSAKLSSDDSLLDFDIFYSQSTDPLRFGNSFDMIGTSDSWEIYPPEILSEVFAMKILTKEQPLLPGESIAILFKTLAPLGASTDSVAWNSFAADVTYKDTKGILQHLLGIEPDKVGVKIVAPDDSKGRISGFVFWDDYNNGKFLSPEQHRDATNDVGVVLYNQNGIPLRATFTSPNENGLPGFYRFSNLEIGGYYVRFFLDTNSHDFAKINLVSANGISTLINLVNTQYVDDIIVGIRSLKDRKIEELLQVNRSSNSMLRNVIYDQMLIGMKMEALDL